MIVAYYGQTVDCWSRLGKWFDSKRAFWIHFKVRHFCRICLLQAAPIPTNYSKCFGVLKYANLTLTGSCLQCEVSASQLDKHPMFSCKYLFDFQQIYHLLHVFFQKYYPRQEFYCRWSAIPSIQICAWAIFQHCYLNSICYCPVDSDLVNLGSSSSWVLLKQHSWKREKSFGHSELATNLRNRYVLPHFHYKFNTFARPSSVKISPDFRSYSNLKAHCLSKPAWCYYSTPNCSKCGTLVIQSCQLDSN